MKPKIGITIGDPNGIGAELILKLLNYKNIKNFGKLIIITPKSILDYYSKKLKIIIPSDIEILEFEIPKKFKLTPGKIDKYAGYIAGKSICTAIDLIKSRKIDSILTMPISKIALQAGGYKYSGHTEMLKILSKSPDTFMFMYYNKRIYCPLTIHIPLSQISRTLSKNFLFKKISNIYKETTKLYSSRNIRAAVLSLNPHSGENNTLGIEESKIIIPAIKQLNNIGIKIEGPFAPDGFFGFKKFRNFDLIIGMYHDQIMIPFKLISGIKGVNITAGLKFIRTSPAHGTAFDIAGKGIANPIGTIQALKINYQLTKKLMTNYV
ncbi:MAG: isocitrate/isopropylmalate family dehydrogenase [Ignavibacteria bacterium]|nr:isocitrate/isopropylmalate family dehydrogenase [Ignavibacteria bacterium]